VTLAWLQGSSVNSIYSIYGPPFSPVWVTSQHAGRFSKASDVFPSGASSISLAGAGDVVALGLGTQRGESGDVASPALVATSLHGGRFGTPVQLDPRAGPPAISVDGAGDVLATWFSAPTASVRPAGTFAPPTKLDVGMGGGINSPGGAPSIDTVGRLSLISSVSPPGAGVGSATTFGVFATS